MEDIEEGHNIIGSVEVGKGKEVCSKIVEVLGEGTAGKKLRWEEASFVGDIAMLFFCENTSEVVPKHAKVTEISWK